MDGDLIVQPKVASRCSFVGSLWDAITRARGTEITAAPNSVRAKVIRLERFQRLGARLLGSALLTALLVALLAASGCGAHTATNAATSAHPTKGGVLVVTFQGDPQTLDPGIDYEVEGWAMEHCLFNTLLTYQPNPGAAGAKLVPDLAVSLPEVKNGGKTYVFRLRPDIRFAPPVNREVTAEDFKYSFERMMRLPLAPATYYYLGIVGASEYQAGKTQHVSGFKVLDQRTIEIDLINPDVTLVNKLTMPFCAVIPKEWVAKWGKNVGRHPLGTGPFTFDHWTPGQEMVFKRNPNYYASDKVWLDGVRFAFSLNTSTALLKLLRGDVDVLGDYLAPADYVRMSQDPTYKKQVYVQPAIAMTYLFMNVHMKPFDSTKVRQAVSWAINRAKIVRLLSGTGQSLTQIYPAGLAPHENGAGGEFYGYDPQKAKQLLAEAGYPQGFATTIYSHNVDPWPKVMTSIQYDLSQIGIKASIKLLDRATYYTLDVTPGKMAVGMSDWWSDFPDPSNFIGPLFSKESAVAGGSDPSFWWSPQVDQLLQASNAMTNVAQRTATFVKIQQLIMDQAPIAVLYQAQLDSMVSKSVGGFYLSPTVTFDFPACWKR